MNQLTIADKETAKRTEVKKRMTGSKALRILLYL